MSLVICNGCRTTLLQSQILDYAFWTTLHDGSISDISGTIPGDLVLTVDIAYLCAYLPTNASSVQVTLRNCTGLAFTPFDGAFVTDLAVLASRNLEILSADFAGDKVEVICVDGQLSAAYVSAEVRVF